MNNFKWDFPKQIKQPSILGFPLWFGKIKKGVAKKFLHDFYVQNMQISDFERQLEVGYLVYDSYYKFNLIIESFEPRYSRLHRGAVMTHLFVNYLCGGSSPLGGKIYRARTQSEIETDLAQSIIAYADLHKTGPIDDDRRILEMLSMGIHVVDEYGMLRNIF